MASVPVGLSVAASKKATPFVEVVAATPGVQAPRAENNHARALRVITSMQSRTVAPLNAQHTTATRKNAHAASQEPDAGEGEEEDSAHEEADDERHDDAHLH